MVIHGIVSLLEPREFPFPYDQIPAEAQRSCDASDDAVALQQMSRLVIHGDGMVPRGGHVHLPHEHVAPRMRDPHQHASGHLRVLDPRREPPRVRHHPSAELGDDGEVAGEQAGNLLAQELAVHRRQVVAAVAVVIHRQASADVDHRDLSATQVSVDAVGKIHDELGSLNHGTKVHSLGSHMAVKTIHFRPLFEQREKIGVVSVLERNAELGCRGYGGGCFDRPFSILRVDANSNVANCYLVLRLQSLVNVISCLHLV